MEPKFNTLRTIYEMVQGGSDSTKSLLSTKELILHYNIPWDEVVNDLKELNREGYIVLHQLSVSLISITGKGIEIVQMQIQNQQEPLRNLKYSS